MKEGTVVPSRNFRILCKSNVKNTEIQKGKINTFSIQNFVEINVKKQCGTRVEVQNGDEKQKNLLSLSFIDLR
jgi:hypothetical protein